MEKTLKIKERAILKKTLKMMKIKERKIVTLMKATTQHMPLKLQKKATMTMMTPTTISKQTEMPTAMMMQIQILSQMKMNTKTMGTIQQPKTTITTKMHRINMTQVQIQSQIIRSASEKRPSMTFDRRQRKPNLSDTAMIGYTISSFK